MASGTLYTYPENFRAYKVLIAAQYSGANVKLAPNFVFGETNKSTDFVKKFPLGKVPAFESADGKVLLTESNAIAYYVANKQLRGATPADEARIRQWMDFSDSEILPASCALVFPVLGILPINKKNIERGRKDLETALNVLNIYLLNNTYLAGERVTLADICTACTLLHAYQNVLDPEFRKSFQNVNRWFVTVVNQPQVKAVLGDVKLADKPASYDAAKNKPDVKKESKAKEAAPAKAAPAAAPAAGPGGDEDDDGLPKEPKSKDPLDELPKGTWVMDDFKRFYSNNDEAKSVPYFWEKFDPENYSIWYGEYKYANELTKVFMSCNLISGMYQRLDKMRKNAFASCCLFGSDNDSTISGIWIWRGQDLAFKLSPDWQVDYEVYDWKKLDPSAQTTKDLVQQYLCWTGSDKGGRKFNQGKIFK